MKIRRKREIVAFGIDGITGLTDNRAAANHVPPEQWRELIQRDDVVVLDNRNSFEYRLGHFDHAVDPKVNNRDFPQYVQDHAEEWKTKAEGGHVLHRRHPLRENERLDAGKAWTCTNSKAAS